MIGTSMIMDLENIRVPYIMQLNFIFLAPLCRYVDCLKEDYQFLISVNIQMELQSYGPQGVRAHAQQNSTTDQEILLNWWLIKLSMSDFMDHMISSILKNALINF